MIVVVVRVSRRSFGLGVLLIAPKLLASLAGLLDVGLPDLLRAHAEGREQPLEIGRVTGGAGWWRVAADERFELIPARQTPVLVERHRRFRIR